MVSTASGRTGEDIRRCGSVSSRSMVAQNNGPTALVPSMAFKGRCISRTISSYSLWDNEMHLCVKVSGCVELSWRLGCCLGP